MNLIELAAAGLIVSAVNFASIAIGTVFDVPSWTLPPVVVGILLVAFLLSQRKSVFSRESILAGLVTSVISGATLALDSAFGIPHWLLPYFLIIGIMETAHLIHLWRGWKVTKSQYLLIALVIMAVAGGFLAVQDLTNPELQEDQLNPVAIAVCFPFSFLFCFMLSLATKPKPVPITWKNLNFSIRLVNHQGAVWGLAGIAGGLSTLIAGWISGVDTQALGFLGLSMGGGMFLGCYLGTRIAVARYNSKYERD